MPISRLTRKGQITLPKEVRKALNLRMGDQVEVTVEGEVAILKPIKKRLDEVYGMLSDLSPDRAVSVEEMHEGIARKVREEWKRSESD